MTEETQNTIDVPQSMLHIPHTNFYPAFEIRIQVGDDTAIIRDNLVVNVPGDMPYINASILQYIQTQVVTRVAKQQGFETSQIVSAQITSLNMLGVCTLEDFYSDFLKEDESSDEEENTDLTE